MNYYSDLMRHIVHSVKPGSFIPAINM